LTGIFKSPMLRRITGSIRGHEAFMVDIVAQPAARRRSPIASVAGVLVPYTLVALGLRLIMARLFFLAGQEKIDGLLLRIHIDTGGIGDVWMTLPTRIKQTTFDMFAAKYAALPIPTYVTAYLFTYAEFLLPVCLVLGFATRLSALLLLIMTVLMVIYATPETLWSVQVYWIATLMVLLSVGPGAISLDALIRHIYTRDDTPAYH
jgi:putative oxidoreductase